MSDWSSFEKDKIATDAWRSYLNEGFAASAMQALTAPVGPRRIGIRGPLKRGIGPVRADAKEEEEETSPDEEGEETPFPPVTGAWSDSPKEGPIEVPDGEAGSDLPDAPEDPYGPDGREDDEDAEEGALPDPPEDEEEADAKDAKLKEKIKNVFGGAMDIATLASFFPGAGQVVAGAATAASLLNNLTYEQPRYGWAALDLAAIALSAIPAGAAAAKSPKLTRFLGWYAKHGTKIEKGADAARAASGYATLEEELDEELGKDIAEYVKKGLTAKADNGKYYVNELLNRLKFPLHPDNPGHKAASELEEKVNKLQQRAGARSKLDEAQIKHWQVLAGIKKSVI